MSESPMSLGKAKPPASSVAFSNVRRVFAAIVASSHRFCISTIEGGSSGISLALNEYTASAIARNSLESFLFSVGVDASHITFIRSFVKS